MIQITLLNVSSLTELNGFLINWLVPSGLMLASSVSLHISRQMDFKFEISHIHGLPCQPLIQSIFLFLLSGLSSQSSSF